MEEGWYFDKTSNELLIVVAGDGLDKWRVIGGQCLFDVSQDQGLLKLCDDSAVIGDDSTCIHWESGNAWQKLQVSTAQKRVMFERPYVPLTFLVVAFLYEAFVRVSNSVRHLCAIVR